MTKKEKLALIKLTPEQIRLMDEFLNAYNNLMESGVRIVECDYIYYAFNSNNLKDWRFDYCAPTTEEKSKGWIDEFPFDGACIVPDLAFDVSLDDTLQAIPVNFDKARNLFDD